MTSSKCRHRTDSSNPTSYSISMKINSLARGIVNINFITLCSVENNNMFNFKGSEMNILHHSIPTLYRQKFGSSLSQFNGIRKEVI